MVLRRCQLVGIADDQPDRVRAPERQDDAQDSEEPAEVTTAAPQDASAAPAAIAPVAEEAPLAEPELVAKEAL